MIRGRYKNETERKSVKAEENKSKERGKNWSKLVTDRVSLSWLYAACVQRSWIQSKRDSICVSRHRSSAYTKFAVNYTYEGRKKFDTHATATNNPIGLRCYETNKN